MEHISVVIATLDRGEDMVSLLGQLAELEKLEIIIVDQTETYTDEIQQKIENLVNSNPNFFYYKLEQKGAGNARNFGVQKSSGSHILFIDDDVVLPDDFFTKYLNYAGEMGNIDATAGMVLGLDGSVNIYLSKIFYNKYYGYLFRPVNYAYPLQPSDLGTCNMLIKKDVFLKLGGFDTKLLRLEDSDFSTRFLKAGFLSRYEPELFLIHKLTPTGAVRHLTGLYKSEVYWKQCFYLVVKNFGLYKGRGLLYYYIKPHIATKRLLKNPLNLFFAVKNVCKGYLMAKKELNA